MQRFIISLVGLTMALGVRPAMASSPTPAPGSKQSRAVVLVSGGAIRTPFTTPTQACKDGDGFLPAGNTFSALRKFLLSKGKQVYTAPAMDAWGVVEEAPNDKVGPFTQCPLRLPAWMTIMSTGDWYAGGERLARFLEYLHSRYGITDVDLVGHSNGGMWSRAAIKVLKEINAPIKVRSLVTLSAPHTGSTPPRFYAGEINLAACKGVAFCEESVQGWGTLVKYKDKGLSALNTVWYTSGPTGWNTAQGSALQGIPVTLMGGTYFEAAGGDPALWPYDGTVPRYSALAQGVAADVIPWRACWQGPLVHWIGWADKLGIPRDRSITDNPAAMARVNQAIDDAEISLKQPNRQGCS
ncbi:MAG: esterase/lipase family protein [Cyanobacteriota bacterium]